MAGNYVQRYKDHTGERKGMLLAKQYHSTGPKRKAYWVFACDCGETVVRSIETFKKGHMRDCGCVRKAKNAAKPSRSANPGVGRGMASGKRRLFDRAGNRWTQAMLAQAADLSMSTIRTRIELGWDVEKILQTPARRKREHKEIVLAQQAPPMPQQDAPMLADEPHYELPPVPPPRPAAPPAAKAPPKLPPRPKTEAELRADHERSEDDRYRHWKMEYQPGDKEFVRQPYSPPRELPPLEEGEFDF